MIQTTAPSSPLLPRHGVQRKDINTPEGTQLSIMPTGFAALPADDLTALMAFLCEPHP